MIDAEQYFHNRHLRIYPEKREQLLKYHKDRYPEHRNELLAYQKKRQRKLRTMALEKYGGKCSCCNEQTYEFLVIDHINGGGGKHRRKIGPNIYRWLKKMNYPPGFRILCHNCNNARAFYGDCPHQLV